MPNRFRPLLWLYPTAAMLYYLTTWYAYGGFADKGHPPLWDVEEFVAASGFKFLVFASVSGFLWSLRRIVEHWPESVRLVLGAIVFVSLAAYLEHSGLRLFGWANVFGGRSLVFNHLLALTFFVIQWQLIGARPALQVRSDKASPAASAELYLTKVPVGKKDATASLEPVRVSQGNSDYFLPPDRVYYLEAFGNYTRVYADDGVYLYGQGIGRACTELTQLSAVRIHRRYAVSRTGWGRLRQTGRNTEMVLTDGTVLKVGAAYRRAVLARASITG